MTAGSGSGSPQPIVAASSYTYNVSLRVRHPSLDPAAVTEALRLTPDHSWKAGEARRSQSGEALGGQYRESYWSARLPDQAIGGQKAPLEVVVAHQLLLLARHRDFITGLQGEGGTISLVVEISPEPSGVLTLSSVVSRRLADLNMEIEFQFIEE